MRHRHPRSGRGNRQRAFIHAAQVATHRADDPYDQYKEDMDVRCCLYLGGRHRAQAIGVSLRGGIFGVSMAAFPAASESHDALECDGLESPSA